MKKYEVYLSHIIASRVSHLSNKYHLKGDITFLEAIPFKELSQIDYETTWYLVSNDYINEIERLNDIINKAIEYIKQEIDIEKICRQEKSLTICKKELLGILKGEDK